MRRILFITIAALFLACNSDDEASTQIPECVQQILDDSDLSKNLKTIKVQKNKNEIHYWLNTGFTNFDGVEFIVNSTCDTICLFCGECIPPECSFEYEFDDWMTVWER